MNILDLLASTQAADSMAPAPVTAAATALNPVPVQTPDPSPAVVPPPVQSHPDFQAMTQPQPQTQAPDTVDTQGITVDGQKPLNLQSASSQLSMPDMQATPAQLAQLKPLDNLPAHEGMFHVKGTLRNILGILGDAFLVQSGHQAVFAPKRAEEKLSDSLVGFSDDPLAAIRRATALNPQYGMKLYDQYNDTTQRDYSNQTARQRASQYARDQEAARTAKGATVLGQYAGAALDNPAAWDKVKPILQGIKDKYSLGDEYNIPDKYDPDIVSALATGGMTRNNQIRTDLSGQRLAETERHNQVTEGVAQQNAAANTKRANRAPAGRVDHGPALTNVEAGIAQAVADGTATPGQQAYFNARLAKTPAKGRTAEAPILGGPGKTISAVPAAGPKPGYKNKYGLVFQGGDPNVRANWK